MLLFYAASLISSILAAIAKLPFKGFSRSKCPECGSPLLGGGNYFSNGEKINLNDCALPTVYIGANIGLWVFLLRDGLYH
jgi:hypothetical protein